MRSRVLEQLDLIVRATDNLSIVDHYGANWNFLRLVSARGLAQRFAHKIMIAFEIDNRLLGHNLFTRWNGSFNLPLIPSIGAAAAMGREESPPVLPKQWPNLLQVCFWNFERIEFLASEKAKDAFAVLWRKRFQPRLQFEQEHQPVRLAGIAMLADESGKVKIRFSEFQPKHFGGLAAGASVRRFARRHVQLPAAGAPEPKIWFLRSVHKQHLVCLVKTVQQRRHFIGHGHVPQ